MAEVSNLHHREEFWPEEDFFLHSSSFDDVDSFSFQNDFSSPLFPEASFDFDDESGLSESDYEDPKCFSDGEGGYQMSSVADLAESQGTQSTEDPVLEYDSERVEESGGVVGLGEIGMDSESDEFEINSGNVNDGIDGSCDGFRADDSIFQTSESERDEFEWEEVSERMNFDEREAFSSVIDQIEEISVSADIMSEEENLQLPEEDLDELGSIEWEVLLSLNGLGRNFEYENAEETNLLAMEHDALFGQLAGNGNSINGSPPAAKCVLENLPMVVLSKEELGENSGEVVCAVCKEGVGIGETITRIPCCHLFHGDCIVPWLRIRNTCPVCRYELPTDDAEYERRRRRNENGNDARMRYNFELLP